MCVLASVYVCAENCTTAAAACSSNGNGAKPIWYGHHESNLVSNLFINIRDTNKLKGKGHSANNTAALCAFSYLSKTEGETMRHEMKITTWKMETMKGMKKTILNQVHFAIQLVLFFYFIFSIRYWSASMSDTCQVNQFSTYFFAFIRQWLFIHRCILTQTTSWWIHFSLCHQYIIIRNDWLYQPFIPFVSLFVNISYFWPVDTLYYHSSFFFIDDQIPNINKIDHLPDKISYKVFKINRNTGNSFCFIQNLKFDHLYMFDGR